VEDAAGHSNYQIKLFKLYKYSNRNSITQKLGRWHQLGRSRRSLVWNASREQKQEKHGSLAGSGGPDNRRYPAPKILRIGLEQEQKLFLVDQDVETQSSRVHLIALPVREKAALDTTPGAQ
jgi:hypothetical protein